MLSAERYVTGAADAISAGKFVAGATGAKRGKICNRCYCC